MKTSLVVKCHGTMGFRRACVPADNGGKLVPGYMPSHTARGIRGDETTWTEPEAVHSSSCSFRPKQGVIDQIRQLPDEAVEALEKVDTERAALEARLHELRESEQQLLRVAFDLGSPLTVEVAKRWVDERKTMKKRDAASVA